MLMLKRPSHYLLLFVSAFAAAWWAGWLPRAKAPPPRSEPQAAPAKGPVVVRPNRPPRARPVEVVLDGRVLDSLGFARQGAEVAVDGAEPVRTDTEGQFRLRLSGVAPIDVTVRAEGCRAVVRRLFPAAGEPAWIALEPAAPWDPAVPAPLSPMQPLAGEGMVRDANGQGLPHAVVAVAETGARARTDEFGRYRIPLPGRGATLTAFRLPTDAGEGLCGRASTVSFAQTKGLVPLPDLIATPGAEIRGSVRDANGQPLAGVPLHVTGEGQEQTTVSAEDGSFRLSGLLGGVYELAALSWRGALGLRKEIRVDHSVHDCELHMVAAEESRLRVVTDDGDPVAGAFVSASVAGQRCAVSRCDEQGWVELRAAPHATQYEVHAGEPLRALALQPNAGDSETLVVAPF
jgi:hypothetical protein